MNPDLWSCFRYNIIDPSRLAPKGFEKQCVLICIATKLEYTLHPQQTPSISTIRETANLLNMNIAHPNLDGGIRASNFEEIEQLNHNFSPRLINKYRFLEKHEGIALNLFRISKNVQTRFYHLYPTRLSKFWNDRFRFSIDLLEDSSDFWLAERAKDNHVLLIKNYFGLVNSFLVKNKLNTRRFFGHCKSCGLTFNILQMDSYNDHINNCQSHSPQNAVGRRKIKNRITYKPFTFCKYKNKYVRRTMKFPTAKFHTTMAPLITGSLDFEASNIPAKNHDETIKRTQGVPANTKYVQKPLAFSFGFFTPYERITLPPELSKITVKFLNEKTHSVTDLYTSLLRELQKSLLACHFFYIETLQKDFGPPTLQNMAPKDRLIYLQTNHCSFCGLTFRKQNAKTRHHNHYLNGSLARSGSTETAIILCRRCNLSSPNDGCLTKIPLTLYSHNLTGYDGCIFLDLLTKSAKSKFGQYDALGNHISLPYLHGKPQCIFKNENTVSSIKFRLSCSVMSSCPFHSLTPKERRFRKRNDLKIGTCPYQRYIEIHDSLLILPGR